MGTRPKAAPPRPADGASALLPRRFQPQLTLGFQQDLAALATDLVREGAEAQVARLDEAIDVVETRRIELSTLGVPPQELQPTTAYAVALRLLRDLLGQGWQVAVDDEGILLHPPAGTVSASDDPSTAKKVLRQSFAFARDAQLAAPSTSSFIASVERRGIERLFVDGSELAERLTSALERNTLDEAIIPRLELVTPDGRDAVTGIRLQDVWRYARHFWSIPYQSTPGRNLFYLVRDEAWPTRPVIGIAALGNAVLGLAQRDEALGWAAASFEARLADATPNERRMVARHLLAVLDEGIESVYAHDLPFDLRDHESVRRLRDVERQAALVRRHDLALAGEGRTDEYVLIRAAHEAAEVAPESVDWQAVARTTLYRRKRAGTLADLLQAALVLRGANVEREPDALLALLKSEEGRRAVETALRRIKQRAIAENVMEIITCGAVPPYGEILGGKLVAMLLASPRVVEDFQVRYRGRVSLIASGLKGEPVQRTPNLVFLTTSSLYAVGSSQYDRIRIPGEILGKEGQISYRRLGTTESFGTVHFAPETAAGLVVLARMADENRRLVSHLFGEGMSPKLRALRSGLEALGLPPDVFLRHHSPRLLYGAALANNAEDVLFGISAAPDYVLTASDGSDGTDEVAAYWRKRWLTPRLRRSDVLSRLRAASRDDLLLGKEVAVASTAADSARSAPHTWLVGEGGGDAGASTRDGSPSEFVERLYRSSNSYADRLNAEELEWVNVDLGLEDYLLEQARAGRQVIVTGNPGDGKTHLIERIRPRLEDEGALVLTDANELTDEELLIAWRTCDREQRSMILAINEWPLFVLRRHANAAGFPPLAEALRQVQEAVFYIPSAAPASAGERVRVVDLSLRNVLAPATVHAVIDRLTHERFYDGLHEADPALANRAALLEPRVRERLGLLLERVARRGHHATMRHLVGFVAYLITAGRSSVERLAQQGSERAHYSTLAFEGGVGPLFDAVRAAFDPGAVTHPAYDDALWRGTTDPQHWIEPGVAGVGAQRLPEQERISGYLALKRRFFFEHERGGELLDLLPVDERTFESLAVGGQARDPIIVRDLVLALNRFFEPDAPESEHDELHLWQSHRFDVRSPETFVALHSLGQRAFRIEPPKFALWVEEWLPADQRLLRSFALVARSEAGVEAILVVDRSLYLTLAEAQRGLSRASWSRSATRKVTRFVDRLHELTELEAPVYDVRIRNTEVDLDETFEVQREPPRYLV